MRCPHCQSALVIVEFQQVEIDVCPGCGGCWLDAEEIGYLLHGEFRQPEQLDERSGARSERRCPLCGARLRTGPFPDSRVEVDVCPMGHGLWLDRGELASLLKQRDLAPSVQPLSRYLHEVFAESVETGDKQGNPPAAGERGV